MNTPQSLPNKITVTLTKDHFTKSDGYRSNSNCALAVALNNHFEEPVEISVGGTYIILGSGDEMEWFDISDRVTGRFNERDLISEAYNVIDRGGDIEPIVVDLFKMES